jgi:hypothetical protein
MTELLQLLPFTFNETVQYLKLEMLTWLKNKFLLINRKILQMY